MDNLKDHHYFLSAGRVTNEMKIAVDSMVVQKSALMMLNLA